MRITLKPHKEKTELSVYSCKNRFYTGTITMKEKKPQDRTDLKFQIQ